MAFDWKKKLQEGKEAATTAFGKAAVAADKLADKAEVAATDLVNKLEEKLTKKKDAPKNDTPKNG